MTAQYSSLKPSKNKFNGQIPSHWNDVPIRSVCKIKSVQNNIGEELLSVFLDRGVVRYSDTSGKQVHKPSDDMSKYQLVEPRDIVLNNQQAWRGSVGVSQYRGIVSPAYIVMSLDESINDRFVNYMIRNQACVAQFVLASKGVGSIQRILSPTKLKSSFFTLPPREEQDQIVRYLNWKVSQINKQINLKKKQIELLKELNEQYIRALVFGETINVPMKKITDIPWLNRVPEHWQKARNKNVLFPTKTLVGDKSKEFQLLSLTTRGIIVRDIESGKGKFPSDFSTYQNVKSGNLVFCLFDIDETPRTVGLSDLEGMITGAYDVFEVRNAMPEFLYYYYLSVDNAKALKPYYTGLRKVIKQDVFMRIPIYLPSIEEQNIIVGQIIHNEKKIKNLIENFDRQIEQLIDLKKKITFDAITGKIDVRTVEIPAYENYEENGIEESMFDEDLETSEVD